MLIIRHTYQQSSSGLLVSAYDISGIYNALSNPTGYNSPNASPSDFVDCTIAVYAPDPTTLLPSTTVTATIDAYPTLPTTGTTPFNIDSAAVWGASQQWNLGFYRFVVTQNTSTDPPTPYTSDNTIPIFGELDCCIDNLILNAELCGCNKKDYSDLLLARAMLDQLSVCCTRADGTLSNYENCNLINKAIEVMQFANSICLNSNCAPCAKC